MRWPLDAPRFGRAFGWRTHPTTGKRQFHQGQDFPNNTGSPLYAVKDAEVYTAASVSQNPGGGNFIGLRFLDGSGRCRYFHMQRPSHLRVGDRVREGDVVGYLGNTGSWTTGPHLHFEISDHKGVAQDPRSFISTRIESAQSHPAPSTPAKPKPKRRTPVEALFIVNDNSDIAGRAYRQREDGKVRHLAFPKEKEALEKGGGFFVGVTKAEITNIIKRYGSF